MKYLVFERMAYNGKRLIVYGVAGLLMATLIITTVTTIAPSVIIPALTRSVWYTQIDATFNVHNPDVEKESLVVSNRIAKGIFLSIKPSVEVEEMGKVTPPTGVVNFTTTIELFGETSTSTPIWSYTTHLAGLGRKHFIVTLSQDLVSAGNTYKIKFTTRLKITPPSPNAKATVDLTRTFEETFKLLDEPSQRRLQEYVEKPTATLDANYYNWLLQTLYDQKGSYFMDKTLNYTSTDEAFQYVYKQIAYKSDVDQYRQSEYFAKASETITNNAGDCEDKSILFASTLYLKAIDQQAKVVAGKVLDKGHAWVEAGEKVYDPTNNIVASKSDYYSYVTALYFSFTYDSFTLLRDAESSTGINN